MWLSCASYGVYVVITGSMWLLQGICGNYRDYVAVTGLRGNYRVYVAVTGSTWHYLEGCHVHPTTATSHLISRKIALHALHGTALHVREGVNAA